MLLGVHWPKSPYPLLPNFVVFSGVGLVLGSLSLTFWVVGLTNRSVTPSAEGFRITINRGAWAS
jgi:hypothetical protein